MNQHYKTKNPDVTCTLFPRSSPLSWKEKVIQTRMLHRNTLLGSLTYWKFLSKFSFAVQQKQQQTRLASCCSTSMLGNVEKSRKKKKNVHSNVFASFNMRWKQARVKLDSNKVFFCFNKSLSLWALFVCLLHISWLCYTHGSDKKVKTCIKTFVDGFGMSSWMFNKPELSFRSPITMNILCVSFISAKVVNNDDENLFFLASTVEVFFRAACYNGSHCLFDVSVDWNLI